MATRAAQGPRNREEVGAPWLLAQHVLPAAPARVRRQSLMFEYDATFKVQNQMGPRVTSNGEMPIVPKNMHVRALSDFMKTLLLCTPSEDNTHEMIESGGIDPMGPLTEKHRAERQEIYKQHAFESVDMEDLKADVHKQCSFHLQTV